MTRHKVYSFKDELFRSFVLFIFIPVVIIFTDSCSPHKGKSIRVYKNITDSIIVFKMVDTARIDVVSIRFSTNNSQATFSLSPEPYNFSNYKDLVLSIVTPAMSEKQKALILWEFVSDWVYYCLPAVRKKQMYDPLKMLNSFECGICGSINATLANLDSLAGLRSRVYSLGGHVVTEVFYDNGWHMFDADQHVFFRDSTGSVASVDYISRHPELVYFSSKRNHPYRSFPFLEELMKCIYSTRENNQISSLYKEIEYDYKNKITLRRNDEIKFSISKVRGINKTAQFFRIFSNPLISRNGVLIRKPYIGSEMSNSGTFVINENSPYAIKRVSISLKSFANYALGNLFVYYSPDGNAWYFKGILGSNFSEITFIPFNENKERIAFSYYLKLKSMDKEQNLDNFNVVSITNEFLFSDKIFVNHKNSFRIVKAGSKDSCLRMKIETD